LFVTMSQFVAWSTPAPPPAGRKGGSALFGQLVRMATPLQGSWYSSSRTTQSCGMPTSTPWLPLRQGSSCSGCRLSPLYVQMNEDAEGPGEPVLYLDGVLRHENVLWHPTRCLPARARTIPAVPARRTPGGDALAVPERQGCPQFLLCPSIPVCRGREAPATRVAHARRRWHLPL
jgi:hypothetical protein